MLNVPHVDLPLDAAPLMSRCRDITLNCLARATVSPRTAITTQTEIIEGETPNEPPIGVGVTFSTVSSVRPDHAGVCRSDSADTGSTGVLARSQRDHGPVVQSGTPGVGGWAVETAVASGTRPSGWIEPGEQLYSKSGRALSPVPKFNPGGGGQGRRVDKVRKWLLSEARQEQLPPSVNLWLRDAVADMQPNNLSVMDADLLREVLFGDSLGPTAANRALPEPIPAEVRAGLRR